MPTIRERIGRAIGGAELKEKEQRAQQMLETLMESQFYIRRDPASLMRQLQEVDPQLIDLILEQRGWQRLGGAFGTSMTITEQDRLNRVATARYMTFWDTQSKLAVNTWTDFGFGQKVTVTPMDPRAQEIWGEFWMADRNRPVIGERVLHEQSDEAVITGELFYSFWTGTASGHAPAQTTIRSVRTEEISEIVTMPMDAARYVWFVQNVNAAVQVDGKSYSKVAYRNWMVTDDEVEAVGVPDGAIDAAELRPNTDVVMLYAARNRYLVDGKCYRGWPEFSQAYEWFRAYRDALGDVMAKNRAAAMFVDKVKITGGSRSLGQLQTDLTSSLTSSGTNRQETNPAPVAGSTWLENQMVDRSRFPMGTGASDDQKSTMIVLGQGSAGTQVPLGWMGRPDSWQNKAVADVSVIPFNEAMQRYQTWWASVFRDIARVVLTQSGAGLTNEQMEVKVTLDTLLTINMEELIAVVNSTASAAEKYIIPMQTADAIIRSALRMALTKFGIADAEAIVTPEQEEPTEVMARILTTVRDNLRDGTATPQNVAEFAVAELFELMKETGGA